LVALQPDGLEHGQQQRRLVGPLGTGPLALRPLRRSAQQAQSALAMVAAVEAELVENTRLEPTPGPAITAVNFGEIFAFGG